MVIMRARENSVVALFHHPDAQSVIPCSAAASTSAIWRAIGSATSESAARDAVGQRRALHELQRQRLDGADVRVSLFEAVDSAPISYGPHRQRPRLFNVYTAGMKTTVRKWGNSLGLRIPKAVAEEAAVVQGSTVDVTVDRRGRLIVKVSERTEYALEELLARVTEQNLHREIAVDRPRGREVW
jgi:antitoxin MazE